MANYPLDKSRLSGRPPHSTRLKIIHVRPKENGERKTLIAREKIMTASIKAPGKRVTKEDIEIGTRIYKARVLRNKTKVDLAAAMDSSYQQLGKYESGVNRVSATMLKKIAEYLGVDINYLLLLTDDPYGQRMPISNNEYEYRRRVLDLLDALENRSQKDAVINLMETMVRKEEV